MSHVLASGVEVGLWFDAVGGPTEKEVATDPSEPVTYTIVTKNLGSKDLNVTVAVLGAEAGWRNRLFVGGAEVDPGVVLHLPRGRSEGERRLQLVVTPPPLAAGAATEQALTIRAIPEQEPASFKAIDATTRIAFATDVKVQPSNLLVHALPGTNATFWLNVTNTGQGEPSLRFHLNSDAPASWPSPRVDRLQAAGRLPLPSEPIGVSPGKPLQLVVSVPVPPGESAGKLVAMRLGGRQEDASACDLCEAILYVLVRQRHDLALADLPPLLAKGGNVTAQVTLDNRGNLDEDLEPILLSLPPQWQATLPRGVWAPRNGSATFPVAIAPARGAAPGVYNVSIGLVSKDGNVTQVHLEVQVAATGGTTAGEAAAILAQPGGIAMASFPLRNDGNVPLLVKVEPAEGEPWGLPERPPPFHLAPGAAMTLQAGWQVPRGAPDGSSVHRLRLALTGGPAAPQERIESATVTVGRSDLHWESVAAFPGAAGTLVRGVVANRGDRAGVEVEVLLEAGGRPVDTVTVGLLPPGAVANVTLLLPRGHAGDPHVLLDPEDRIVERDESNNAAAVP
ncbi:MAG TPA: CARDB domain-containing protein, partial [Candidatus Thermoplasmatota archaeon]|nr:CARDB domain-containing protein [Candidatus Thermoplasmatota archaeon]